MTTLKRTVAVRHLPRIANRKQGKFFVREIQDDMNVDRPRIVIDCSGLRQIDKNVIYLLLCCLEEAMKRNGDVKLASLPPGSAPVLQHTGVSRLFDVYETAADAVNSFHQLPAHIVPAAPEHAA